MTNTKEEKSQPNELVTFIVGLGLALALLYVGGWSTVWGKVMLSTKSFILNDHGFAIRFNSLYYGASFSSRFFDSPAISWICLMIATGSTGGVFFISSSSEEES